jgi:hypothetical protein
MTLQEQRIAEYMEKQRKEEEKRQRLAALFAETGLDEYLENLIDRHMDIYHGERP